jgi:hypothetical protein
VRVDPSTLRIFGPRVELGRHDQPWSRSPDGSFLAVAGGRVPSLVVVDVTRMRALRSIPLDGSIVALVWPEPLGR